MSSPVVHRILIIDDNPAIHEDFRKLFVGSEPSPAALQDLESLVLGAPAQPGLAQPFELDTASQGQTGLQKVQTALAAGRPYSLAFVDIRMPPGWDGVETIERLWKADPELQVVICTAYSDYSWEDMRERLGNCDGLLILKKPFDTIEVLQIAHALTRKWELARQVRASLQDLDRKVAERTRALDREMTERAEAEEKLRHAQKMDAVGQLAAGIAHDFNNLLTVICGHVHLLMARAPAEIQTKDSLKQISLAAERAARLTRQLLVFSRKEVAISRPVDLNRVLTNANTLLSRLIGEHLELRFDPAATPAWLTADEGNLDQILMNLAVNARDAMPGGGLLTMRTSIENLDAATARLHPQARPGTFVCLTIADTGCGMDNATLNRIFEPFFTTKEVGKGTGLGLATVYGIVQQLGGWIEVESQPGKGTTFKIFFPQRECPAAAKGQTEFVFRAAPPPPGKTTVLVVEDEPGVREFLRTVLEMNAYRVLEAADGVEALKVWAAHHGEVNLLLTDMVMPNGISGRGLADKLKSERPALKVIYASGYSAETIGADWLQSPEVIFLPKPFTADALLRAVSTSLSTKFSTLAA